MMKVDEQTRLHGWIAQLRERGHVASKQRMVIMEALFQQREITDMEDFWVALRQKHPVSWATFYNFIRLALKENWIGKDKQASNCTRYQILID